MPAPTWAPWCPTHPIDWGLLLTLPSRRRLRSATRSRMRSKNARYPRSRSLLGSGSWPAGSGEGGGRKADLPQGSIEKNGFDPRRGRGGDHCSEGTKRSLSWALDVPQQSQNEHNDQERSQPSGRVVAPSSAVRPSGHGADDQNDQNDKYDKAHFGLCSGPSLTRAPQQRHIPRSVPDATCPATSASVEMRQFVDIIVVSTRDRGLVEITRDVLNWLEPHRLQAGLLTLFCRHTSAGLLVQENAAADVRADLETFFDRLAPQEAGRYRHTEKGADDMPADIRTALTGVQLSIPIVQGELGLGTWQVIYLFEHRRAPRRREVALHLIG